MEYTNFLDEIISKDVESGKVKEVITRFPPEPNGWLHIGHCKAIFIDYGLARKYNGKYNLRFDDTNPAKEDEEFCKAIIEDINWLGFQPNVVYASDYFQQMYECAVLLIKKGKAFVCELNGDQIREYRGTLTEPGKPSPYRNRTIEENLELFQKMKDGLIEDGAMTLRAKIDMNSPNINMRDPIIYRVLHASHYRAGDKWCIYPTYDFAHPIEDAIEHISHSMCSLEFEDHRPLYDWVVNECEFDPAPHQFEFARLNLTNTIMSKRYLKKLVDTGVVDGWDDPRMPTISGLRRRGYPASALEMFCDKIGVSKANSEVDYGLLEYCVRDVLNPVAKRKMVVIDPIEMVITNWDNPTDKVQVEVFYNEEYHDIRPMSVSGNLYIERDDFAVVPPPKYKRLTLGGKVKLKGLFTVQCDDYELDSEGKVTKVYCSYLPDSWANNDTSGIKVKGVIHWVDKATAVDVEVNKLNSLLVDATEDKQDFSDRINPDSKITYSNAKAEADLLNSKPYEPYQFMRQSYYCRDPKVQDRLVFNETVSLKSAYKITK